MHGEIGLESVNGRGSTFWFTAELEAPQEPIPAFPPVASLFENHHALIVDDNATNRNLLIHLCTAWRLRHRAADGSVAALDELRAAARAGDPFDVIILDHHMPDIDGLALAALVSADRSIPRPQILLLTSRSDRLHKTQLGEHGLAAC